MYRPDSPIRRRPTRRTTWWSPGRRRTPRHSLWSTWWPSPDPTGPCYRARRHCPPAARWSETANRTPRACTAWKRSSRRTWRPEDRRHRCLTSTCQTCNRRRKSTPAPVPVVYTRNVGIITNFRTIVGFL